MLYEIVFLFPGVAVLVETEIACALQELNDDRDALAHQVYTLTCNKNQMENDMALLKVSVILCTAFSLLAKFSTDCDKKK